MWHLQGFDPRTEKLVQETRLPRLDPDAIRRMLDVYDGLPIEPFDFDIPTVDTAQELATYSDTPVLIDPELSYQLAFYTD